MHSFRHEGQCPFSSLDSSSWKSGAHNCPQRNSTADCLVRSLCVLFLYPLVWRRAETTTKLHHQQPTPPEAHIDVYNLMSPPLSDWWFHIATKQTFLFTRFLSKAFLQTLNAFFKNCCGLLLWWGNVNKLLSSEHLNMSQGLGVNEMSIWASEYWPTADSHREQQLAAQQAGKLRQKGKSGVFPHSGRLTASTHCIMSAVVIWTQCNLS